MCRFFYPSRSYHGRNRPPRKSTPSVSIAKASGLNLSLAAWPSTLRGQLKVPFSKRLVRTQAPFHQIKDFKPSVAPINKNKERSSAGIFSESLTHQTVEPLKLYGMSQGSRATKIFRLPLKLSILWPRVVRDCLTTPRPDRLGLRWLFQDGPLPANAPATSLREAIPCLRVDHRFQPSDRCCPFPF